MWRKPVPSRRVTLTAELTLASVYFTRKKLISLPEPKGKAHALIILPWLSFKTELTQLDQPKCLYGETLVKQAGSGHPLSFVCGWVAVCRADLSPVVSWSSIEKSGFSPFCSPPSHHPSRSLLSRFSRSTRVDCEQSPFFLRFSEAIFVSRAFRSRD